MYVDANRMGKGSAVLVTYQDPALGAFGQSGAESAAVWKLQAGLRAFAATAGVDYNPGAPDGRYGKNTHAAVLRVARDYLEPTGKSTVSCRSLCNSLRARAKSGCAACLSDVILPALTSVAASLALTPGEIADVVEGYRGFLDAYVAEHGDSGAAADEAMEVADETATPGDAGLPADTGLPPGVGDGGTPAGDAVVSGEIPDGAVAKASFPWAAVVLATVLLGGVVVGTWYYTKRGEKGVRTLPEMHPRPFGPARFAPARFAPARTRKSKRGRRGPGRSAYQPW
jgi:hypothetical protein